MGKKTLTKISYIENYDYLLFGHAYSLISDPRKDIILNLTKNFREFSWMSQGVVCLPFLFDFLFMLTSFDIPHYQLHVFLKPFSSRWKWLSNYFMNVYSEFSIEFFKAFFLVNKNFRLINKNFNSLIFLFKEIIFKQALKFRTLVITIYHYCNLDLAVMIAKII